ncbi:hypothetical protein VTP01DRAFT_9029 [Rhizomucor pusillus]|uniref:uncharacterized protein n=1 Tax=Rhizomucor pusillus TaxID=4840 RepID=UPI0037436B76
MHGSRSQSLFNDIITHSTVLSPLTPAIFKRSLLNLAISHIQFLSSVMISHLIRDLRDTTQRIGSQRINKHIHSISN